MSTAELKSHLHKLIVETEDMDILQKVQAYFAVLKTQKTDWWEMISESEKRTVKQGLKELREGKGIPHTEVKKKVAKLLGR
ncbi:MAG: hypothetical protein A2W91_02535 [Bacteroidetes bacterium GWF2_38_335]|nr:MAG: hypothetical protein A2W91_02535 [Bacteroidetes bacterium GWF2_38_335]OFY80724.1 MAG: hypothetical protein A2281_05550 [Bacteroidetes bacterium RIFOXYA12_FULL_38_20]HBS87071.1 hypothetical protein [Bacteroidales bacterium]